MEVMDEARFWVEVRRAGIVVLRAATARDLNQREFWGQIRRAGIILLDAISKRYGYSRLRAVE